MVRLINTAGRSQATIDRLKFGPPEERCVCCHDLWQRSEMLRGVPFPMWWLVDGKLEYRYGTLPAGTTIRAKGGTK